MAVEQKATILENKAYCPPDLQKKYIDISHRVVYPCKSLCPYTMKILKIGGEVSTLIGNIGWGKYISITYPAYEELLYKFYTTFSYKKTSDTEGSSLRFIIMGVYHKISIDSMNELLRVMKSNQMLTEYPLEFDPKCLYVIWSTSPTSYNLGSSMDNYLKSRMMKYIHWFLAYNFSGKGQFIGNTKQEEVLHTLVYGERTQTQPELPSMFLVPNCPIE